MCSSSFILWNECSLGILVKYIRRKPRQQEKFEISHKWHNITCKKSWIELQKSKQSFLIYLNVIFKDQLLTCLHFHRFLHQEVQNLRNPLNRQEKYQPLWNHLFKYLLQVPVVVVEKNRKRNLLGTKFDRNHLTIWSKI